MSTRAQVQVYQDGPGWDERVTLYHHCDGYPNGMMPLFREAFEKYGQGWEGGRVGKVASFLCAVHPGQFEPEEGHELHGDIQYYYKLRLQSDGSSNSKPVWFVTIYKGDGFTIVTPEALI